MLFNKDDLVSRQDNPPANIVQRKMILSIAETFLVKQRDEALDRFATRWLMYRGLPLPPKEGDANEG